MEIVEEGSATAVAIRIARASRIDTITTTTITVVAMTMAATGDSETVRLTSHRLQSEGASTTVGRMTDAMAATEEVAHVTDTSAEIASSQKRSVRC